MESRKKIMQTRRHEFKIHRKRKEGSVSKMATSSHMWLLQFWLIKVKQNKNLSCSALLILSTQYPHVVVSTNLHPQRKLHQTRLAWSLLRPCLAHSYAILGHCYTRQSLSQSEILFLWFLTRQPTPVFLGFPCGSAGKESACNAGDLSLIPGLERYPGEGKGNPLQNSGLGNSMDCVIHRSQRVWHDWMTLTSLNFLCSCPTLMLLIPEEPI